MNILSYLAAPYTHKNQSVVEWRMQTVARVQAILLLQGRNVVTPLSGHWLLPFSEELGKDWAFWERYSTVLMEKCGEVILICLPGWDTSTGVAGEFELSKKFNLRVTYLEEAWLRKHLPEYNPPQL